MKIDFENIKDEQLVALVNNRWESSNSVWEIIDRVYRVNTAIVENKAAWLDQVSYKRKQWLVQANRIFPNMESVINSVIANPPGINILPARRGEEAQEFASRLENYMRKKFNDLNAKETVRMGLRNLYFGRLIVIKPFWNPAINDFDFRAVDPRKLRVGKYARKEQDSEFSIEEIEDNLCAVVERFPKKRAELMKKFGFEDNEQGVQDMYVKNPDVKYKEAWIQDYVVFKLDNIVLGKIKNPYWDWDGILITEEEEQKLNEAKTTDERRNILGPAKLDQDARQYASQEPTEGAMPDETLRQQYGNLKPYFFNYFDNPRKPYIFATIFNNENSPIGRTDMITLASDLQRGIDKRKMDIDENCELVNGMLKVDAGVMGKSDAQRIRFETKGIIWGKGVKDGVTRETGPALPVQVFTDMEDSRKEIDNIMAASSAFRGEREGQETKAGRLALIQQSFLRLNELTQVVEYIYKEMFEWGMQLAKTRYTEHHYAKWMGKDDAQDIIEIIQDDFETGSEVTIIPGKTLPVDDEFKFEQAQNDFKQGALGLVDYLRVSKYDDPKETAKNTVAYKVNPVVSVGMTDEEIAKIQPPQQEEKPPSITINYADLPPDGQVQLLAKIGIQVDENLVYAEKIAEKEKGNKELSIKERSSIKPTPVK